jgi:hypothetical protein
LPSRSFCIDESCYILLLTNNHKDWPPIFLNHQSFVFKASISVKF